MTLFSLAELYDEKKVYQQATHRHPEEARAGHHRRAGHRDSAQSAVRLVLRPDRFRILAAKVRRRGRRHLGEGHVHPLDIVFRLAEDHGIVLLNGGGFDAPDWSVRVSFANLDEDVYDDIGRAVRAVARGYVMAFRASQDGCRGVGGAQRIVRTTRHGRACSSASLRHHPEVTFFLVLGIGYLLGKLKLGGFTLGAVTGTLLAGVAIGQLGVQVSGEVKQCFFLLFLFSIGFRTGPQFFRGLKSDGLQQAALSAIVATTGLAVAYVGQPAARLRRRHGGGRDRRLADRVGDDRNGERRHRAARPARGRDSRDDQPDSRRLCRHLPDRRGRRRLVPGAARAADHGRQPRGGMPPLRTADAGRQRRRRPRRGGTSSTAPTPCSRDRRFVGRSAPRARSSWRAMPVCSSSGSGAAIGSSNPMRRPSYRPATRWRSPGGANCWSNGSTSRGSASSKSTTGRCSTFRPRSLDVVVTTREIDGRTLADIARGRGRAQRLSAAHHARRHARRHLPGHARASRRHPHAGRADTADRRRPSAHRRFPTARPT